MSDSAGVLSVEINGKDVNLSALLERIEQQLQKADATGKRTGESLGSSVGAGAQRGASGALSLQQALSRLDVQEAKLARAQGDTARAAEFEAQAEERLRSALAQVDTTTVQTVNAQRQLASIQTQNATGGAGLTSIFGQMGGTLGGLATAAGPVAAGFVALEGARKVIDFAKSGADADLARQSFDQLAQQSGTTGAALLAALQQASKGEVADLNLELAANRAQLLGVAKSAGEFSTLMEIARDRAQKMGSDTSTAFNDLVTGLGRASPMILDNLGITVKVGEANEIYAAKLGKAASALTDAEKKQALINAVMAQGKKSIEDAGGAIDGDAASWTRAGVAFENAKSRLAGFLGSALAPAAEGFARVTSGSQGLDQAMAGLSNNLQRGGTATAYLGQMLGLTAGSVDSARNTLQSWGVIQVDVAAATQASTLTMDAERQATVQNAAVKQQAGAIAAQFVAQIQQQIAVSAESANQSLLDAQAKGAQAAQTQLLQQQTINAASAFLTLNPNIDGSGVAAAVAAGKISAAVGQYIAMTLATGQATAELARLQAQAGQAPAGAPTRAGGAGRADALSDRGGDAAGIQAATARLKAQTEAEKALADAQRARTLATGSNAEKQALLNRELENAARIYGKDSAEYVRAQTAMEQFRQQQSKSGGAAKLSDQQKLNGALLADQEQFADKFDDADLKHAQNRLKIQQDFYKKLQDAQDKFDSDQLAGRASFYDNIGQIESDKIRKSASAAYEAAALEAGKIAQEKGADVADKYMAAQERIIQARAKRQADIEAAAKSGDKGKAENLRGVDELYRKSEEDQLKRITEANDSIAAQRDQAMAEENRAYEEQTGKIADSADRAAERKILAAERAGKALDTEQLKLDRLASTYDRIAPGGGAPAQASPAPQPTPTPAAAATPAEGVPLAQALDALSAAVGAVERAVRDSGRGVEGAVRGLAGRMAA